MRNSLVCLLVMVFSLNLVGCKKIFEFKGPTDGVGNGQQAAACLRPWSKEGGGFPYQLKVSSDGLTIQMDRLPPKVSQTWKMDGVQGLFSIQASFSGMPGTAETDQEGDFAGFYFRAGLTPQGGAVGGVAIQAFAQAGNLSFGLGYQPHLLSLIDVDGMYSEVRDGDLRERQSPSGTFSLLRKEIRKANEPVHYGLTVYSEDGSRRAEKTVQDFGDLQTRFTFSIEFGNVDLGRTIEKPIQIQIRNLKGSSILNGAFACGGI